MKRTACLILTLALSWAFVGGPPPVANAQTLKKITFLTNYVFNGRHSPFFVGLEKGFYKEAGFDIDIKPTTGSGFVITALDGGQADYGMANISPVVQGLAKGAKVKAFMVYTDITTDGLAALSPYPTAQSVIGKKIAAGQTDSARVILPIVFDLQGLDASKIDWQAADPSVYISLLMNGRVDLYTASFDSDVPALKKVAESQGKTVHFSSFAEWGYDIYGYVLLGAADALAKDPGEAQRFAEATRKAVEYSIANPDEAAQIMIKHNPTMDLELVKTQWSATIQSIQTPYVAQNGYGAATQDRIERSIALTQKALKLEGEIKPDDLYMMLK
jgi:NitT/TauT family transport system substrate-binding protein